MEVSQVKKLREIEGENARLKKMYADRICIHGASLRQGFGWFVLKLIWGRPGWAGNGSRICNGCYVLL